MSEEPIATMDLSTFVRRYAPMTPHKAALFVASLADQLAARHAEGLSSGMLGEHVQVEMSGGQPRPVLGEAVSRDNTRISSDIRQIGVTLARLLGVEPTDDSHMAMDRGDVPGPLWKLIVACLLSDSTEQPTAAILARELRVAGRDLLLGATTPGASRDPAAVEAGADTPAPAYVPSEAASDGSDQPPARSPMRRRLLFSAGLAVVLVAALGIAWYHDASEPSRPSTNGAANSVSPQKAPDDSDRAHPAGSGTPAAVGNPATARNLLPDPGAEQSPPGWAAFGSGVLSQVTTGRNGSHALRITTNATEANSAGATNRPVQAITVAGRSYQASCWVRSTANVGAYVQVQEFTTNWKRASDPAPSPKITLGDPDRWYQVSITYEADRSGNLLPLSVFSNGLRAGGAELLIDDCSLTQN
ncbi:hypothetical protein ACIBJE_21495 [Micromonospora sp. NPDC050187]|uniref:hypothetical protein n=1 Tax=Micromonospora sp. NPDC050187 TaxID=3364277 RepID=UPI00379C64EC